jgi:predicted N-acetyltransferase YhbS
MSEAAHSTDGGVSVRCEEAKDHRVVEEVVRNAFWNLYRGGADEHLIIHRLRTDSSFVPSLCLVAQLPTGEVVGVIAFSHAQIVRKSPDGHEERRSVLTFGPLAVSPLHQGIGIGSLLVRRGMDLAASQGYAHVVIHGDPRYYHRFGFRTAEIYGIRSCDGMFATCCLAASLRDDVRWDGMDGRLVVSPIFDSVDEKVLQEFDSSFPARAKEENTESQKLFQILVSLKYP